MRDIDKFPCWTINKKPHHSAQTPTVEARAVITLSKIQAAQADSDPLEKWQVIGTLFGGEPGLADKVGKTKGEREISLLTTIT